MLCIFIIMDFILVCTYEKDGENPGGMKYQKKVLKRCRKNIRTYQ